MTQGAFAAVLKDDKVLLIMPLDWVSEYPKHWNFPGGVVEINESLQDGAKREVFEETGIVCEVGDLIHEAINDISKTEISIFKAKYVAGEIKIQEIEVKQAQWFNIDEALKLPLAYEIKKILVRLNK